MGVFDNYDHIEYNHLELDNEDIILDDSLYANGASGNNSTIKPAYNKSIYNISNTLKSESITQEDDDGFVLDDLFDDSDDIKTTDGNQLLYDCPICQNTYCIHKFDYSNTIFETLNSSTSLDNSYLQLNYKKWLGKLPNLVMGF